VPSQLIYLKVWKNCIYRQSCRLWISSRIRSQNRHCSKGSVRDLWGSNLYKNPRKSCILIKQNWGRFSTYEKFRRDRVTNEEALRNIWGMREYLVIYEEGVSKIWLCTQFPIFCDSVSPPPPPTKKVTLLHQVILAIQISSKMPI
jgi:hypothetical protein